MVFKNVKRIQTALPEVEHVVMFYNNGTIFQTTLEQSINIPKLGENFAEVLYHFRKIYEICNFKLDDYVKVIFETNDFSTIILKLGEDSNLALFFKKENTKDIKISSIRRYLKRIEVLIDMDKDDIEILELARKEEELYKLELILQENNKKFEELKIQKGEAEREGQIEKSKELSKQIEDVDLFLKKLAIDKVDLTNGIMQLQEKIKELKKQQNIIPK